MDVSKNRGTSKSSILKGFSIVNHPFWGTPIFGNTQKAAKKRSRSSVFLVDCLACEFPPWVVGRHQRRLKMLVLDIQRIWLIGPRRTGILRGWMAKQIGSKFKVKHLTDIPTMCFFMRQMMVLPKKVWTWVSFCLGWLIKWEDRHLCWNWPEKWITWSNVRDSMPN